MNEQNEVYRDDREIFDLLLEALQALRDRKKNRRYTQAQARCTSVVVTQLELTIAYFVTYISPMRDHQGLYEESDDA